MPLSALPVLDNTPTHPPGLEENFIGNYGFVKVMSLPVRTIPLIQATDQQDTCYFEKLCTKALFQRCFDVTSGTRVTLREF